MGVEFHWEMLTTYPLGRPPFKLSDRIFTVDFSETGTDLKAHKKLYAAIC